MDNRAALGPPFLFDNFQRDRLRANDDELRHRYLDISDNRVHGGFRAADGSVIIERR